MESNVMDMTLREAHEKMWEFLAGPEGSQILQDWGIDKAKQEWLYKNGMPWEDVRLFDKTFDCCFLCLLYRPDAPKYEAAARLRYQPCGNKLNMCAVCPDCPLESCSFSLYSPYGCLRDNGIWAQHKPEGGEVPDSAAEYIARCPPDYDGRYPVEWLVRDVLYQLRIEDAVEQGEAEYEYEDDEETDID